MAHTFNTPKYPNAPHSTPSSNLTHQRFNPKIPRPPVHNPFDKFSETDFDVWIGNITGDIKKALGYEDMDQQAHPSSSSASSDIPPTPASGQAVTSTREDENDYLEADSYVEDSFADVKARRAADKGKGRDPREGPGLGLKSGEKDQPIEILSEEEEGNDNREEEEEDEQIFEFDESEEEEEEEEGGERSQGEGEEEVGEEEEEQGSEEYELEHSVNVRNDRNRKPQKIIAGKFDDGEMDEIEAEDDELLDGEEEEEGDEVEHEDEDGGATGVDRQGSEELVELLPDDKLSPSDMKHQRQEEDEFLSDGEEAADVRSSPAQFEGDTEQVEEYDGTEAQEPEEAQPSDDDTSFPPRLVSKTEPVTSPVDIRDPWAPVDTYAQDYYAGGEVIPDARGRLSAHHLGINDDGSGFLSPDVVSNAESEENEGEEEEEDGEPEAEYEMEGEETEGDDTKDSDDFDENEHLFNRLQPSYARRGAFMPRVDARGTHQFFGRQYVPSNLRMEFTGSGTTDEPIMIDSDDEVEPVVPPVQELQPKVEVQEQKELGLRVGGKEEEEEQRRDQPTAEGSNQETIPASEIQEAEAERPLPTDQHIDAEPHPISSTITTSTQPPATETNEQPIPEVLFLPTPPAEPPTETTGDISGPYVRTEVSENAMDTSQETPTGTRPDQAIFEIRDGDLASAAPPESELDRHLEVPIAGPQHMTDNTRGVFGLEEDPIHSDFDSRDTTHTPVRARTRGGSVTLEEVEEDEEDEWDELDEPGAFPLMTSDLAYPEGDVDVDDMDSESAPETTTEPATSEGYVMPAEVIEVEENDEDGKEVKISIEEPEGYDAGSPLGEFVINVQRATPLPQSRGSSPAVEKRVHFEDQPLSHKLDIISEDDEGLKVLAPSSPPIATSSIPREATAQVQESAEANMEPIVIDLDISAEEPAIEAFEEALKGAESFAIIVEEEGTTHLPEDHTPFELPAYSVEEPLTDSEYRGSEGPQRDMSIGIASVEPEDVIPPTTEKGYVEETSSDVDQIGTPEGMAPHEDTPIHTEADTEDVNMTGQVQHETQGAEVQNVSSAYALPSPSLEPYDDDYFAQPGTPVMTSTDQLNFPTSPNGGLPSIIQLPGTSQKVLSPVSSPGPGPIPVSIAMESTVLRALKENPSLLRMSSPPIAASTTQPPNAESISPVAAIMKDDHNQLQSTTDIASLPEAGAHIGPAGDGQLLTNNIPTSFPVTTVAGKPTLFSDPYPYSLSTPGPPNVATEEGSEGDTEQDNSLSSASSAEKELNNATFRGVAQFESNYFPSKPIATVPVEMETNQMAEGALDVDRDIADIEAEADALINQFLVDEPESDTDADGEADPEFVHLESSVSGRASEESVGEDIEVDRREKEETGTKQPVTAEAAEVHGTLQEAITLGSDAAKEPTETEEDPFKLMGNDSLVAPGEASTPEDESESEANVVEAALHDTRDDQEGEGGPVHTVHEKPQDNPIFSTQTQVEVPPLQQPPFSQVTGVLRGGPIGVLPYHAAAAEYMHSQTSTLQRASRIPTLSPPPLEQFIAPVYSLQDKQQTPPLDPNTPPVHPPQQKEEADTVTQPVGNTTTKLPPKRLSLTIGDKGNTPQTTETKTEGPQRRVHISVEDPYNADNDSDHERESITSRPSKRKRSRSDEPHNDLPPVTPKSISTGQGKRKTTSSRTATKGSRPRKEKSRKSNLFDPHSRSPSVASTIISDSSFLTQPSPTHPPLSSSDPRPFLHAHSRKKRNIAPTTMQEQLHKQLHKSASAIRSGVLRAEDVLTKAPTILSTSTSSPVTRSHCRYHQISIPKTEDGPRINFLVPGCSLNDETLITEEEIEDHGEAIIQGNTRIVDDIQTLDFEPYLLWVMRQLVGTEILRENEVFYLPEPGEEIVRRSLKPEKKTTSKPKSRPPKSAGENTADGQRDSVSGRSGSRDSSIASSSTSVLQRILGGSDMDDLSTVTETEDENPPKPKAPELELEDTAGRGDLDSKPEASTVSAFSRKRARRLGQDAFAYKPSTDEEEAASSSSDASDYNPSRKPPRNRSLKRPRPSEANATEGVEGRKTKKPKTSSQASNQSSVQSNPAQSLPQSQTETQTQPSVI